MSAIRLPGPDGHIRLVPVDDGAVGRISHTRYGIRGTAVTGGVFVVAESQRTRDLRMQREAMARLKAPR